MVFPDIGADQNRKARVYSCEIGLDQQCADRIRRGFNNQIFDLRYRYPSPRTMRFDIPKA